MSRVTCDPFRIQRSSDFVCYDGSSEDLVLEDVHLAHTEPCPLLGLSTDAVPDFPAPHLDTLSWSPLEEPWDVVISPALGCTLNPTLLHDPMEIKDVKGFPPDRQDALCHPHTETKERRSSTNHRGLQESLRRKRMSKWFSRLERLLPQEVVQKFDRCSVIEAAIRYIRSMEETIAKASRSNSGQKLVERPPTALLNEGEPSCSATRRPVSSFAPELPSAGQSIVTLSTHSEDTFVNVVSCRRDPILFSSILSLLQKYKLEIVTATMSRTEEMVMYCVHAKKPSACKHSNELLQGDIYNIFNGARPTLCGVDKLPQSF